MQTFVPYDSFSDSAKCLDYRRLGKQRVETLQILNSLTQINYGWANHPATLMWKGHENGLCAYGLAICAEWIARGYKDTCFDKIKAIIEPQEDDFPSWWGDQRVHGSHRANLLRKSPEYYGKYDWTESPDMPYYWPNTEMELK